MNTSKTLALAAVAAMSLGIGAAMAQGVRPNTNQQVPAATQQVAPNNAVQSGSSDVYSPLKTWIDESGARTDSAYYNGGGSG
jgi:hypothetical protein